MKKVWIIEEDGTHTPGDLIAETWILPGNCKVLPDGSGVTRFCSKRNVIDHATAERLR